MMYTVKIVWFFIILLCSVLQIYGSSLNDSIPMNSDVKIGRLDNGFSYYVQRNVVPAGKVELQMVVKAGYCQEEPDQLQLAHLLEHVAFGTTEHFKNVTSFLRGERLIAGTDFNASTGFLRTSYRLTIPSNNKRLFNQALLIIHDWCGGIVFDSATIAAERNSVLNEIGLPRQDLKPLIRSTMDPLFGRDINAERRNVVRMKEDRLKSFYEDWYRPDLQAVIVVGDVDVDSVVHSIRSFFSDLRRFDRRRLVNCLSSVVSREDCYLKNEMDVQNGASVFLRRYKEHGSIKTIDDLKRDLCMRLCNIMFEIRSESTDKSIDFSSYQQFTRRYFAESNFDGLESQISSHHVDREILRELIRNVVYDDRVLTEIGFNKSEVDEAKRRIEVSTFLNPAESMSLAGRYVDHFVRGDLVPSDDFIRSKIDSLMQDITVMDVNSYLREWSKLPIEVEVRYDSNGRNYIPEVKILSRWVKKYRKYRVKRSNNEVFMPEQEILSAEENEFIGSANIPFGTGELPDLGTSTITLANGVVVVLKPVRSSPLEKGKIKIWGSREGGASLLRPDEYWAARLAPRAVSQSGIGSLTGEELSLLMSRTRTSLIPYVLDNEIGFLGESDSTGREYLFQLLYKYFRAPKKDARTFERVVRSARLSAGLPELPSDSVFRAYSGELSFFPKKSSLLDGVAMNNAYDVYSKIFSNLNGFVFVIAGDFNVSDILPLVVRNLGAIESKDVKFENRKIHDKPDATYQIVENKGGGQYNVEILFFRNAKHSYEDILKRDIFCRVLKNVLFDNLRQKMGGAYSISTIQKQIGHEMTVIEISFNTNLPRRDVIVDSLWNEIRHLAEVGVTENQIDDVRSIMFSQMKEGFVDRDFWCRYFLTQRYNGMHFNQLANWERVLSQFTNEDVRGFAKQLLEKRNFTSIGDNNL